MIDYAAPDFDPNAIANQDPSQWDAHSHALAIHGGIEDAVDSHIQATGQLPDTDQTAAFVDQAIREQAPFMSKTEGTQSLRAPQGATQTPPPTPAAHLKGPFISQKSGGDLLTEANGGYVNAHGNHAAVVDHVENPGSDNPLVIVTEQYKTHPASKGNYGFDTKGATRIKNMSNYSVVRSR